MKYSIKQLARKTDTTIRTLHYYDEIGILRADRNSINGYRYYSVTQLIRLHQINYFKSLGFSLESIKEILDNPMYDEIKGLEDQKKLLLFEKKNLTNILTEIDTRIIQLKGGVANMSTTQTITDEINKYKEKARERWGHTDEYKQSQDRISQWNEKDWDRTRLESETILTQLATLTEEEVSNDRTQSLIADYHGHMNNFYDCSYEIFRNLGEMYVQDQHFGTYYRERGIEPTFIRDAIIYYCEAHQNE